MISHKHQCLFIHVPKTAGKSVLSVFGLPLLGRDYTEPLDWIEDPYGHQPIRRYMSRPWFNSYFKFCFVRNPWDRVVSAYFFLNAGGLNEEDRAIADKYLAAYKGDFEKFVRFGLGSVLDQQHFRPQTELICNRWGAVAVDFVGRFENFAEDLNTVTSRIGIEHKPLGKTNKSIHANWREYYSEHTASIVARAYASDIKKLGYSFA